MLSCGQQVDSYNDDVGKWRGKCSDNCANLLLDQLNSVKQNLAYANETIGREKTSSLLMSRLENLEVAINENSKAFEYSKTMSNLALEHLKKTIGAYNIVIDGTRLQDNLSVLLDDVENRAASLESRAQQLATSVKEAFVDHQLHANNSRQLYFKFRKSFNNLAMATSELLVLLQEL